MKFEVKIVIEAENKKIAEHIIDDINLERPEIVDYGEVITLL